MTAAASLRLDRTAAEKPPATSPKFDWQMVFEDDVRMRLETPDGFKAKIRAKGEFNFQYEIARPGGETIIDRALSRPGAQACVEMLIEDLRTSPEPMAIRAKEPNNG